MRALLFTTLLLAATPWLLAQSTSRPVSIQLSPDGGDQLPPEVEVRLAGTQLLHPNQVVEWASPYLFFTGYAEDRSGIQDIEVNGLPMQMTPDGEGISFEHTVALDTLAQADGAPQAIVVRVRDRQENEHRFRFYAQHQTTTGRSGSLAEAASEDAERLFDAMYGESHALLIGVSDYETRWRTLPGVRRDLDAVADVLRAHDFSITRVVDPTLADLTDALDRFFRRFGNHEDDLDNRLLVYFAGHGYTMNDMGYLVPADAPAPSADASGFRTGALAMSDLRSYAEKLQSKHALFVFDACFSGSIFGGMRSDVPVEIAARTQRPVRLFVASGTDDQEVPDESIFRHFFVRALEGEGDRNRDGYITGLELGSYLYDQVTHHSDGTQTPDYGKLAGSLRFSQGDVVFQVPD